GGLDVVEGAGVSRTRPHAEAVVTATFVDARSGAGVTEPVLGQVVRVLSDGVTDADTAGGAIRGVTYVWQMEVNPGTGVFEDIVLKPGRISVGFPDADGSTFFIDPAAAFEAGGLNGVAIRVRAVYEDDHGVTEQAFS